MYKNVSLLVTHFQASFWGTEQEERRHPQPDGLLIHPCNGTRSYSSPSHLNCLQMTEPKIIPIAWPITYSTIVTTSVSSKTYIRVHTKFYTRRLFPTHGRFFALCVLELCRFRFLKTCVSSSLALFSIFSNLSGIGIRMGIKIEVIFYLPFLSSGSVGKNLNPWFWRFDTVLWCITGLVYNHAKLSEYSRDLCFTIFVPHISRCLRR